MSKLDVRVVAGGSSSNVIPFLVDDRTTSGQTANINPGEPVQVDNANFVEIIVNGGPLNSTGAFVGIAHDTSSETSSAEGEVNVDMVIPYITIMRAKATTAANVDTEAELKAIRLDAITFDNTANVITIDEDEGDDPNEHGLVVVGGNITAGTLDFYVKPLATVFGNNI